MESEERYSYKSNRLLAKTFYDFATCTQTNKEWTNDGTPKRNTFHITMATSRILPIMTRENSFPKEAIIQKQKKVLTKISKKKSSFIRSSFIITITSHFK